jgi:pyruvate/2-oxoglutarate/acetoin dehydrogenase E1 component
VFDARQAAEQLATDGIDAEVIELRTRVPLGFGDRA